MAFRVPPSSNYESVIMAHVALDAAVMGRWGNGEVDKLALFNLQLAKNRQRRRLGAAETEQARKSLDSSFPYSKYLALMTICLD
mgnify:CR=1 FL=1